MVCVAALVALAVSARVGAAQAISPERKGSYGGTIYGTVSASTGAPVGHALVKVVGTSKTTIADSVGSYILSQLPVGISILQINGTGLEPLTVRVMVPSVGRVRVDVILSQSVSAIQPESLPPVRVRSATLVAVETSARVPAHTPGVWEWKGDVASAPETSGEPDVFRLLVSDPRAMMRSDGFGGTSVDAAAGAIPDRVFVDGLPVWNPLHGGNSIGAINPDVVGDLRVSDGAASARYGDALFETVDVETREATLSKPSVGVGLGPTSARGWWGSPLRVGATTGQLLIAGRRSSAGVFPDRSDVNSTSDHWRDGLAVLSLRRRRTAIQLIAIGSGDNLAADVDDATVGAKADVRSAVDQDQTLEVPWRSMTLGAVWTEQISPAHTLVTRMWQARFATTANSSATTRGAAMSNSAREVGVGTELNLGSVTLGASMERIHTSYNTAAAVNSSLRLFDSAGMGIDTTTTQASHTLRAGPTIFAAYAERRWGSVSDHWTATSGIRATALSAGAPRIEPRLSMSVDLPVGIVATAGYASTHQFVQSVRDVTYAGGALVPVSFPVAAGSADVPVAAAQTVTADLSRDLGAGARMTVGAYDRKFKGLISQGLIVVPSAGDGFDIVDGRTIGIGSSLQGNSGNLTTRMTYGVQRTALSPRSTSYLPPKELAQTASAAVEWRAAGMTRLRILGSIGSSFPGTMNLPDNDLGEAGASFRDEASVQASRMLGTADATLDRLPMYMRIDLGAIREWSTADMGRIGLTVTVANVFDRPNVAAFLPGDVRGGERVVALTPRSLLAGITWHQ